MKIRVIDLANNFYKDEGSEDKRDVQELGEYCCLGYFDALGVKLIADTGNGEINIRKEVNRIAMENLNGRCNRKNIVCVTNDDDRDEEFWISAGKMPFLFVSLIRMKRSESAGRQELNRLQGFTEGLNKIEGVMAYYTYDHSDIVVFKYGNQYLEDLKSVLSLCPKTEVFKMYSVFAIKEAVLETCEGVVDEKVNCRLSAIVKSMDKVKTYIDKLKKTLNEGETSDTIEVNCFDMLGNSDLLIDISGVSIRKLLCCYKMGRLLTHANQFYGDAFFNIESQIYDVKGWDMKKMIDTAEA